MIRLHVQINGRLPLIKKYVIEYSNRDEVTATFVYERLERHCSVCYRLDHEVKDCLEAKAQKRALLAKKELNETTLKQTLGGEHPDNYLNTREVFHFSASRKKDDRVEEGSNANHNRYRR